MWAQILSLHSLNQSEGQHSGLRLRGSKVQKRFFCYHTRGTPRRTLNETLKHIVGAIIAKVDTGASWLCLNDVSGIFFYHAQYLIFAAT